MNERIKELAEQAGCAEKGMDELEKFIDLERFVELIEQWVRADERDKCAQDYLQDCCDAVEAARLDEREQISHTYLKLTLDAVLREREACAKLCEENMRLTTGLHHAAAIRQRGEK